MKRTSKIIIAVLLISNIVFYFSSCKKEEDEGLPPTIALTAGTGYISKDSTVAKSTAFKIGAAAAKSEANDVLTKMILSVSYDNGADSIIINQSLSGTQGDTCTKDYSGTTRNQTGTEKYTFKVINKDGLINTAVVKLTVQ